jgi:Flp pilus assembly pilin Flp
MKSIKPFLRDERGAIAVIFGLLLPALLGFAALAIEVGYWYSEKDKLQIAADSAAYSALVAYSADKDLNKAIAVGVAQAQASGYSGTGQQDHRSGRNHLCRPVQSARHRPEGRLGYDGPDHRPHRGHGHHGQCAGRGLFSQSAAHDRERPEHCHAALVPVAP